MMQSLMTARKRIQRLRLLLLIQEHLQEPTSVSSSQQLIAHALTAVERLMVLQPAEHIVQQEERLLLIQASSHLVLSSLSTDIHMLLRTLVVPSADIELISISIHIRKHLTTAEEPFRYTLSKVFHKAYITSYAT